MTEFRRPALLDPRRRSSEQFDSGTTALDEWLRRYAGQNRIDRSATPAMLAKGAPDPVPALLLGRLAVDRRHANLGIGTALAAHVLATAVELNQKAACRAVVVTALNASVRTWWERLRFHPCDPNDAGQFDLYLLTDEIEATLKKLRWHG